MESKFFKYLKLINYNLMFYLLKIFHPSKFNDQTILYEIHKIEENIYLFSEWFCLINMFKN